MVFPAQSGSKLWPSLCALGTRPTAIPILPLAFPTQSRTVPPPLHANRLPLCWPSPQRTSCSGYSEIAECSGVPKHLACCACDPGQRDNPSSGGCAAPMRRHRRGHGSFVSRREKEKKPFVFLFSSSQSSKAAERCLTCFLMKRCLSYQWRSWFLSLLLGLIRRLQRGGPLLQDGRVASDGDLSPPCHDTSSKMAALAVWEAPGLRSVPRPPWRSKLVSAARLERQTSSSTRKRRKVLESQEGIKRTGSNSCGETERILTGCGSFITIKIFNCN